MTGVGAAAPAFDVGDFLPRVTLLTAEGAVLDLTHQTVAGRGILLWFGGAKPAPAGRKALAELAESLAGSGVRCYAVVAAPKVPAGQDDAVPTLADPDGRVAQALIRRSRGIAIVDPNYRLAAVLGDKDFAGAAERCRAIEAAFAAGAPTAAAPVLMIDGVLEPSLCRALVDYWSAEDKTADAVATSAAGNAYENADFKRRTDVPLADARLFDAVKQRIVRRVLPLVYKAYMCEVANLEAVRIGCYESSNRGEFRLHRDNMTPYTAHRQFALSINLNDAFEGGGLRFPEFGRATYTPSMGGAGVFACGLLHEVVPVTAGRRFVLLSFLQDAAHFERQRQMIESRRGEGGLKPVVMRGGGA